MTDRFSEVRALISREFGIDPDSITPATTIASLQIDSVSMFEFLFTLEEIHHVKYPEFGERPATVGDLAAELDRLIAATSTAGRIEPS